MKRRLAVISIILVAILTASIASAASKPFRFVVIGDNKNGHKIYSRLITDFMRTNPDFVVNTGDVIVNPGDIGQWERLTAISAPITVPYLLTPGNHDIDDEKSQKVWRDQVKLPGNETNYKYVKNNNLFVVLNSVEPGNEKRIVGKQLKWLKKTLASDRYDHKFVFLHHPLFLRKGAMHYGDSLDKYPEKRDALHELFKSSNVDMVFMGHEHTYEKMEKDGILYIITGGAGARLYGGFNHFVLLKVDGDLIRVKVIDRKGVTRDRFTRGEIPKVK